MNRLILLLMICLFFSGCEDFPEKMTKFTWKPNKEKPNPTVLEKTRDNIFRYEFILDKSISMRVGEKNLHFKVPGGVAHDNDFSIREPSHKTSDRFVILYKNGKWIIKTYVYRQGCGPSKPKKCSQSEWEQYVRQGQIKLTELSFGEKVILEIEPIIQGTYFRVFKKNGQTFEAFVANTRRPNGKFYRLHGWSPKSSHSWHIFMKKI